MEITDFLKQLPITMLLAPVVLGVLYIALTVYIFRKAAKRRRLKRELAMAGPQANQKTRMPLGGFLSGELPNKSAKPADWTVLPELRGVPEPDLDMLSNPLPPDTFTQDMQSVNGDASSSEVEDQPLISTVAAANDSVWNSVSVGELETTMAANDNNTQTGSSPEIETQAGDLVEVMRVLRDVNDGKLIIQIGNQRYRALADIKNPDLARRVMAVARELWAMVNSAMSQAGSMPPAATNLGSGTKTRMGLLKGASEQQPMPNMLKQAARPLNQPLPQSASSPGIADAVEDYLQYKLAETPELAQRSIHIRLSHDHGVTIEVDGHFYESIGDVVDPNVREFLFNIMREWEARH